MIGLLLYYSYDIVKYLCLYLFAILLLVNIIILKNKITLKKNETIYLLTATTLSLALYFVFDILAKYVEVYS